MCVCVSFWFFNRERLSSNAAECSSLELCTLERPGGAGLGWAMFAGLFLTSFIIVY